MLRTPHLLFDRMKVFLHCSGYSHSIPSLTNNAKMSNKNDINESIETQHMLSIIQLLQNTATPRWIYIAHLVMQNISLLKNLQTENVMTSHKEKLPPLTWWEFPQYLLCNPDNFHHHSFLKYQIICYIFLYTEGLKEVDIIWDVQSVNYWNWYKVIPPSQLNGLFLAAAGE